MFSRLYIFKGKGWQVVLLERYERLNAESGPVNGGEAGQVDGWLAVGGVGGARGVDCLVRRVAN